MNAKGIEPPGFNLIHGFYIHLRDIVKLLVVARVYMEEPIYLLNLKKLHLSISLNPQILAFSCSSMPKSILKSIFLVNIEFSVLT